MMLANVAGTSAIVPGNRRIVNQGTGSEAGERPLNASCTAGSVRNLCVNGG